LTRLSAALAAAEEAVRPLLDAVDIADLTGHNAGYEGYDLDRFGTFVLDEQGRRRRALEMIVEVMPKGSVVDLGTFIPVLPIALAMLGYQATIVERFELYGPTFRSALETTAAAQGLTVVDLDLSSDDLAALEQHDVVMLMAVLEHLNGSPAALMARIRTLIAPGGVLAVEVPNIAELGQRLRFLLGRSPLPNYETYLGSSYPFTGHNREMTSGELRVLLASTGYQLERLEVYDYVPSERMTTKGRLVRAAKRILPGDLGEVITAIARPL
jgi:hypothetical protein